MSSLLIQRNWLKSLPEYPKISKNMGHYDDSKDYVGAENDWKSEYIPRRFYGVDINIAAYIHDYYYSIGGDSEARFKADAIFLADIMKQIELTPNNIFYGTNWYRKHLARLRGIKYFETVRWLGKKSYNFK